MAELSKVKSVLLPSGLSELELDSVVDGVGSTSSVGLGFLADYPLVGGGDVTNSYCQNYTHSKICREVVVHEQVGKLLGRDYARKVFARKVHMSCGNLKCPLCCRVSWAPREARRIEARLVMASARSGLDCEHIVISFDPKRHYGIGDEKVLRALALKACDELDIVGGDLVFHGSRHRRFERIKGSGWRQFGTDWSVHYHEIGFVRRGYKCRDCPRKSNCLEGCGGFDDRRWQYFKKTGIYVKVMYQKRRSIFWTSFYQINHASIKRNAKRAHVGSWHGICSYRNMGALKFKKKAGDCPVCAVVGHSSPLRDAVYVGKKNFVLNRYSLDYERDTMEDLYEGGVEVWVDVPKRVYGRGLVGGSSVRKAFQIHFAGGNYESV